MNRKKKIEESEEAENQRALDAAAGVARPSTSLRGKEGAESVAAGGSTPLATVTRPPNAAPLLKPDTREKLLYKLACAGTPLGEEFFEEFPDRAELLDLALNISSRLMVVAACNPELAATQRISAIRVLASLAGKQVPEEEDDKFKPGAAPLAIPRGSKEEVSATLDKIRQLSGG